MAREMKDSGIEWVGRIPSTWNSMKLKYVVSFNDETLDETTAKDYEFDYIDIGSVEYGKGITLFQHIRYQEAPSRARRIVRKNDVILSTVRTYLKAVASIEDRPYPQIVSTGFVVLRAKIEKITPLFLKYAVLSDAFISLVEAKSTGISYPAINSADVVNIAIPLPKLPEQHKITDYLDTECARIDAVIEQTRASIEEYKKLKQAVITQAVTKGIRPNRSMRDSGIEWIGNIPSEWKVIKHKYVMHKEKSICEHYNGEDIISLTMNGVVIRDLNAGGKMPTTFDGYQYVHPDDLLLCLFDIDVTPRCVGIVKNYGVTSPAYSRFIVHNGYYIAYYDYLLRSIDDSKVFVHLAKNLRSSLTESDFGVLPTITPSLEEQIEIVNYLDRKTVEINELISQKEQLMVEMESYKKTLIFEYVTGKKDALL